MEKNPRPPQLTGDTPEWGTTLPTVIDPDAQGRFFSLTRKDPRFSWQSFSGRVAHAFADLMNGHDPDAVDRFIAEDYVNHNYFVEEGREANRALWTVWFAAFPDTAKLFLPGGDAPQVGTRFRNPELAATLSTIAKRGPAAFYRGPLAAEIADVVQHPRKDPASALPAPGW